MWAAMHGGRGWGLCRYPLLLAGSDITGEQPLPPSLKRMSTEQVYGVSHNYSLFQHLQYFHALVY